MSLGRSFFIVIAVVASVSSALCTGRSVWPSQESNFDLEGPISKQSPGKLTVDQGQGIIFHVVLDDKTAVVKDDGSSGSEKDLKVGIRVHVIGDLQATGEIKAARIEIEPKQPPPAKSDPQQP
jgi:hypothetical protein